MTGVQTCALPICIYSFVRKTEDPKDTLVFICNFTPEPRMDFRIGVPFAGQYIEIFNSDNSKYGGSGIINPNPMYSENIEYNGRNDSISINIPPLAVTVIKFC